MSTFDRAAAEIARRQHTLLTREDVVRIGGNADRIHRRLAAGRWQLVEPGVYRIAGGPMDWEARQLAAVLSAGPGAATSHLAAARLWGIPGFALAPPEISVPRHSRRPRPSVIRHESTDLDRCQIVERAGIPVTDPDRTLLDMARKVGLRRLQRSVEAMRRDGHVTWTSLSTCLFAHARRGRPGIRKLRAVLLIDAHREEITDTDMELLLLGAIREAGLPEPVVGYEVYDGDRFVAKVDLALPELRIAIECDGSIHDLPEVRERDLVRQNDLVLCGWLVLRISYDRFRQRPDAVIREIRDAIRSRLAQAS